MADWGFKISKAGYNASTNDPREMMISSEYQMFKYHDDLTVSTTFTPGDVTKTVSVTHGLGYVPAFIPYVYNSGQLQIIPSYPYGTGYTTAIESWADTTKIWFKVTMGLGAGGGAGWNELLIAMDEYYTNYPPYDGYSELWIGNDSYGSMESAIRFPSVPVTSSTAITSAEIFLHSDFSFGSGRIKWDTKGIDVDDLAYFTTTNPFSQAQTSANTYRDIAVSEASTGSHVSIDIKNSLDEIRARGGWTSGDPMGFTMKNNSTTADNWFADNSYYDSYLRILLTGDTTYDFRTIVFKDKIHT